MSVATTTKKVRRGLRTKEVFVSAQTAGNYTAGGDTVDLTKNAVSLGMGDAGFGYPGAIDGYEVVDGPAGYIGKLVPGTNLTNWKLKVFQTGAGLNGALGELAAAAYPAGVNADVFTLRFEAPKMRL